MGKFYDDDGIDGPFEKGMRTPIVLPGEHSPHCVRWDGQLWTCDEECRATEQRRSTKQTR